MRKAKIEYEKGVSRNAKDNPQIFGDYVKSKTKTKAGIPDLDIPGTEGPNKEPDSTTSDAEKAEVFLNYFGSVFTIEDKTNIPNMRPFTDKILADLVITKEMVNKKLSKLNITKSPGPDGIHPRVLFELREELTEPFHILFNASLKACELPQDWRDANISAIFKKGKRNLTTTGL